MSLEQPAKQPDNLSVRPQNSRSVWLLVLLLAAFPGSYSCRRLTSAERVAQLRKLTLAQVQELSAVRGLSPAMIESMPDAVLQIELANLEDEEQPEVGLAFNGDPKSYASRPTTRARRSEKNSARRPLARKRKSAVAPQTLEAESDSLAAPSDENSLTAPPDAQAFAPPPGFADAAWTSLGPESLGGRTRSIVIDPANPQRMWVGSLGGGVWRTDDGGQNYHPVDDQMPSLIISCLAKDPTKPATIYAGTGEDFFNSTEGPRGVGIIKITDDEAPSVLPGTDNPNFSYVNDLAISADGRVLLAATAAGLFRSDDPQSGVWTRSSELNFKVGTVLFDPRDSRNAIAAGLVGGEIFFSTDGGGHWSPASHSGDTWTGRVELTYAASGSGLVYASVMTKKNSCETSEIWRSSNGGQSYEVRGSHVKGSCEEGHCTKANFLARQAKYSNTIWAGDPTKPDLVIVGGIELWRSEDGGNTLIDISTWYNDNSAHCDQHCIVADPRFDGVTNRRVLFCNDGGVYQAEDVYTVGNNPSPPRTNGWQALNHGYSTIQFQGAAGHAALNLIVGGTQDNGSLSLRLDGSGWVELGNGYTGDGGFCGLDPTPDPGFIFGCGVRLDIYRTAEGMNTQHYLNGIIHTSAGQEVQCENASGPNRKPPPFIITDVIDKEKTNFVAPFVLDPNVDDRLLAGATSLWRTDNASEPVQQCSGPSWLAIKDATVPISPISSITVSARDSNLIWVGHNNGDVFKTEAGGAADPRSTWVKMNDPVAWPNRACLRIVIDPDDSNIVYATFAGYAADNVRKTIDGGLHWTTISKNLPELPALSFVVHPRNSSHVFVGTGAGVYASQNGGEDWQPIGPTNSPISELFFIDQTLFAATYGRGMFKIALVVP